MITVATATTLVLAVLVKIAPEAAIVAHTVDGVRTKIPRKAWLLGAMALAFGLSEGTAVDWSSLHVTEVAGVDPAVGSLGLVAVSGFMVVIRMVGDRFVARFGRRNVVRFGGICAALGYAAIVGYLVRHLGIHHTMAVPALLCAGIVALALTLPKTDQDLQGARPH